MRHSSFFALGLIVGCLAGCGGQSDSSAPAGSALAPAAVAKQGVAPASNVNDVPVVLNAGWNGVGFQALQVTSLSSNPQVAGLATFSNGSYQTGNYATADVNAGAGGRRGFWIFATGNTSFTYSGTGGPDFVDLASGYNLVSFATSSDLPGSSLTASVNGSTVPLGSVVLPTFTEIGPNNAYTSVDVSAGGSVKAGRAYWIFASTAAQIRVSGGPQPSPQPSTVPGQTLILTNASVPSGTTSVQVRLLNTVQLIATVPATINSNGTLTLTLPQGEGVTQAQALYLNSTGALLASALASVTLGQPSAPLGATSASSLASVQLSVGTGSTTLKVGQSSQLTVTGSYSSGGSTFDLPVTGATFSSNRTFVATVAPSGVVTAANPGSATISATLPNPAGGTAVGSIVFDVTN